MHHFIYPSQDAYISNQKTNSTKNFGLDEILVVGVNTYKSKFISQTKTMSYRNETVNNWCVNVFSGSVSGNLYGTASYISGSGNISGSIGGSIFEGNPIFIPTVGTSSAYPSLINVSGLTGTITKVKVNINGYSHSSNQDVTIALSSPEGTSIVVMSSGIGNLPIDNVDLTFTDDADSPLPQLDTVVSGVWKPSHYSSEEIYPWPENDPSNLNLDSRQLSDFIGQNPNGNWKLYVWDKVPQDSGSINQWSLEIQTDSSTGHDITSSIITGSNFSGSCISFVGSVIDFGGRITGYINGTQTISQSHQVIENSKYVNRALIKYNLNSVSSSIVNGDIQSPTFTLRMKVAKAEKSPIDYTLYALPISQSWDMGNGYSSDGGSTKGASWLYKDYYSGNLWHTYSDSSSFTPIDFINTASNASRVWSRGGGTWYTHSVASQSFSYEPADVRMDVSNIVYSWLSGSTPNNGFMILSSGELESAGSDMGLHFFSKDTNTIYQPVLDMAWDSSTWVTGSLSTSSVQITTVDSGLLAVATADSTISGSVKGIFSGSVILNSTSSGTVFIYGYGDTISGLTLFGNISCSVSSSYNITNSVTSSFVLGVLQDGFFSGSVFTSSLNASKLTNGQFTGSWNNSQISGSEISASYPFQTDTGVLVKISSRYINGDAFGIYSIFNTTSGSFDGTMISGLQEGATVHIPFTGSIRTGSYSYTSSVQLTSSVLPAIQFNKPFVAIIQNLPPVARAGSIIRVNVFSRPEYPLKNFQRKTQFTQFLTPEYLPSSSYYAIKDNETEEILVDFDSYTKLSCDTNGNFFEIDTTGLPQERYFKILIRTEQSGSIYTFDRNDIFKIIR